MRYTKILALHPTSHFQSIVQVQYKYFNVYQLQQLQFKILMGQLLCQEAPIYTQTLQNQLQNSQQNAHFNQKIKSELFELSEEGKAKQHSILNFMLPKYWIKYKDQQQRATCSICYEMVKNPCRCAGPCNALFCMECVANWKKQSQNVPCPQKCSKNFAVNKIEMQAIQYLCPFNKQKCNILINSIDQFNNHDKVCKHIPAKMMQQLLYMRRYKCRYGHCLQYLSFNKTCASCGEKKLSKYICRKCNQYYCFQCRSLQCSKNGCPKYHKWIFYPNASQNQRYTCDFCNQNPGLKGNGLYDDSFCNISSCQQCFNKFPEELPEVCKEIKINNYYKCQKKHPLETLNKAKMVVCQTCYNKKQCRRYCAKCQTYFCFQCKHPQISQSKCQKKHNFLDIKSQPSQKRQQHHSKCNFCLKNQAQYQDRYCSILLCKQCFDYSEQIKQMEIQLVLSQYICQKQHPLHYLPQKRSQLRQCQFCKKLVQCILYCTICSQVRFYCCPCIPPKPRVCYLNHQLKKLQNETNQTCNICNKMKFERFYMCGQNCALRQCQQCYQGMDQFYNQRKDFIFTNPKTKISQLGLLLILMRLQQQAQRDLSEENQEQQIQ